MRYFRPCFPVHCYFAQLYHQFTSLFVINAYSLEPRPWKQPQALVNQFNARLSSGLFHPDNCLVFLDPIDRIPSTSRRKSPCKRLQCNHTECSYLLSLDPSTGSVVSCFGRRSDLRKIRLLTQEKTQILLPFEQDESLRAVVCNWLNGGMRRPRHTATF